MRKTHIDKPIEHPLEALLEMQAKLDQVEAELATFRSAENQAANEELTLKANQSEYFAKQLETARATIDTLEQKMLQQPAINAAAHAEFQLQITELENELAKAYEALAGKDKELSAQTSRTSAHAEENLSLQARAEEAEEKHRALVKDSHLAIAELDKLRTELENYHKKGAIEGALKETIHDLSTQLSAAKKAVAELRDHSQIQQGKLQEAETEFLRLRDEIASQKEEIANLRESLSKFSDSATEIQKLERQLAGAAADLEAYEDLRQAKEQLQHRAALLEAELSEAKGHASEIADLQGQIDGVQSAVFELAQLRGRMKHQRAAMSDLLDHFDDLIAGQDNQADAGTPTLRVA